MSYNPPFQLSHKMMALVSDISESIGQWMVLDFASLVADLRREICV